MKIFSKEQIYQGDQLTVDRQNISSTDLMERAGVQIFNWMNLRMKGAQVPVHVFCGIGNNGGDGLVLARHLILEGYNVKVYIVNYSDKRSKDFLINYDRVKSVTKDWPILLNDNESFPEIKPDDIIVDGIFGIGLNKPVAAWVKNLFKLFKKSRAFTLSIDIPSGLRTDTVPENENDVVWSSYTLSFASPKLVFFLPTTAKYTINWEVLNIGLDVDFLSSTSTDFNLIGKYEAIPIYKPRDKYSHKGDFGHSLIIGGSYGKIGAVTLASRGALASGAGLVTAFVPKCGYQVLQSSFPEAMVITDVNDSYISNIDYFIEPTVIAFGIGVGLNNETVQAFESFLKNNKTSLVIDADGINILAKNAELLKLLPPNTVLTPHPKELERLIGTWDDDFDKLKKAKIFSNKYKVVLIIKGANTITIFEDKYYINSSGNPGLSTAGSGDVLTGIITGLISQGYDALSAAVFGVYLHGKSADIAVEDYGYQSLIASHIIEYLGASYLDLFKQVDAPQENTEEE
jgi:hydroxyethylthiazole kinase-like uncharacterized protein yjeF